MWVNLSAFSVNKSEWKYISVHSVYIEVNVSESKCIQCVSN
jgi:hypothetical protein